MPVTPEDYVHVKNTGDKPIELMWDGRAVTIKPGKTGLATFDQAINSFGHPWASDLPSKYVSEGGTTYHIPSRKTERERLELKYGAGISPSDNTHRFGNKDLVPDGEVYDQDGERIWCVLCDPDGLHYQPPSSTQVNPADSIAKLERQLALLKAQVNATSVAPGDEDDTQVPTDND